MSHRRSFLKKLGLGSMGILTPGMQVWSQTEWTTFQEAGNDDPQIAASDEDYWAMVRSAYAPSSNLINFNNGGVNPHTRLVADKIRQYHELANEAPGYYMWRLMRRQKESVRRKLADLAGVSTTEVAIMRNATQALDTIIHGLNLKKGDEILTTDQDYGSVLNTLRVRAERDGIVIRKIALPTPAEDDEAVIKRFEAGITRKTRAILFCHMINLNGQILPAKRLCDLAREKGILSIVDGAHSFAQLDFKVGELGCDFFATSLHKWLSGPFGTGLLYMPERNIPTIWPLGGYPEGEADKITKFEHVGTQDTATEMAISDAVDFHLGIGTARKEARLRYLKSYWTKEALNIKGLFLRTSRMDQFSCAMATFGIEGKSPQKIARQLIAEHNIYVTQNSHPDVAGVRISPGVYAQKSELDYLLEALEKLAD